jgi:uncharacterized membrane protein YvbJ
MSQYCMDCGAENLNDAQFCKNCGKKLYQEDILNPDKKSVVQKELGFQWWSIWAWLGLILGNLMTFGQLKDMPELALIFVIINTILMIFILKFNKYAFLIATILSINPLLWIINGVYLKNRWCHPKVNNGKEC